MHAEIEGPCDAAIAGVSLRDTDSNDPDTAIEVEKDATVGVSMTSDVGFASHSASLEFGGIQWEVSDQTDNGETSWTSIVNVDDYAKYGVGLYKVVGEATLVDGTTCSGAALIDVQGNPLGTVAGILAVVSVVAGGAALVMSSLGSYAEGVRARRRISKWTDEQVQRAAEGGVPDASEFRTVVGKPPIFPLWMIAALPALLMTGTMVAGGIGGGLAGSAVKLARSPFRPRIPIVGSIGGIFFGEGIVVLLQQYAVQPLTQSSALAGLIVGIGLAIVITTIVRLWSNMETNRAIAAAEARINAALEQRLAASGMAQPPAAAAPEARDTDTSPRIDASDPPPAPPPDDQPLM